MKIKECNEEFHNPLILNNYLLRNKQKDISNIFYEDKRIKRILTLKRINDFPLNIHQQENIIPYNFYNNIKNGVSGCLDALIKEQNEKEADNSEIIESK